MKILKNIGFGSILLVIYTLTGFLFKGNHVWMSFFIFTSTFISSAFYFYEVPTNYFKGLLLIVSPLFLLFISLLIYGANFVMPVFYMFFMIIFSYLAWFYIKNKKSYVVLFLSFMLIGFASYVCYPNSQNYYLNYNAVVNSSFPKLNLVDENKIPVELDTSKIIVLDFWTTSCGVCFKKFPDLEKLYLKYKDNPNVELYSVNVPLQRDTFNKTVKLVDKLGYKYPTIYAVSAEITEKELDIMGYPFFVILKQNRIRFNGSLNIDKNVIIYNTINEIERLINEN